MEKYNLFGVMVDVTDRFDSPCKCQECGQETQNIEVTRTLKITDEQKEQIYINQNNFNRVCSSFRGLLLIEDGMTVTDLN